MRLHPPKAYFSPPSGNLFVTEGLEKLRAFSCIALFASYRACKIEHSKCKFIHDDRLGGGSVQKIKK